VIRDPAGGKSDIPGATREKEPRMNIILHRL